MSGAAPKSEGPKGDKAHKGEKDETIAKAVGAVIAAGIGWSLYKGFRSKKSSDQPLSETVDQLSKDASDSGSRFVEKAQRKKTILEGKTVGIHKGDTLWGLSQKYGVSVEALKAANGIGAGDILTAGDTISIPN